MKMTFRSKNRNINLDLTENGKCGNIMTLKDLLLQYTGFLRGFEVTRFDVFLQIAR